MAGDVKIAVSAVVPIVSWGMMSPILFCSVGIEMLQGDMETILDYLEHENLFLTYGLNGRPSPSPRKKNSRGWNNTALARCRMSQMQDFRLIPGYQDSSRFLFDPKL